MKISNLLSRRGLLGLLGLTLSAALLLVLLRSGPMAPTRVTVTTITPQQVHVALFGIGTVEARRAYLIGPTAAGRVSKVLVDVGDSVSAGQLLAEMDPVDLDQRLAAQDAAIARAASAVQAAQAQWGDATARMSLAKMTATRNQELADQSFISPTALEGRLQEQSSAQAQAQAAQANLEGAKQELIRLQADRAGLRAQRQNLRLVAPAAGVVSAREAEAGSTVVAGQAVLRLVDPSSLWVRVRLDQGRSAGLAKGLEASIVLRSSPATPWRGSVERLELISDSVTEERVAQVVFDARPPGLSVGELAEVTLQLPGTPQSLTLPNASIKRVGEQTGVWRVRAGSLGFQPVRLGAAALDGRVQVLDGLQAGDEVVVYSEKELSASSRFKVVDAIVKDRS